MRVEAIPSIPAVGPILVERVKFEEQAANEAFRLDKDSITMHQEAQHQRKAELSEKIQTRAWYELTEETWAGVADLAQLITATSSIFAGITIASTGTPMSLVSGYSIAAGGILNIASLYEKRWANDPETAATLATAGIVVGIFGSVLSYRELIDMISLSNPLTYINGAATVVSTVSNIGSAFVQSKISGLEAEMETNRNLSRITDQAIENLSESIRRTMKTLTEAVESARQSMMAIENQKLAILRG